MKILPSLALLAMFALLGCANLHADEEKVGMVLGRSGKLSLGDEKTSHASVLPTGQDDGRMYRSMGTLLCLAGLLGGAWLLVRRFKKLRTGPGTGSHYMEFLESLDLGSRQKLLLIRAGNRILVLADFNQQLRMLANLSKETFDRGQCGDFEALLREEHAPSFAPQPAAASADLINWPTAPAGV